MIGKPMAFILLLAVTIAGTSCDGGWLSRTEKRPNIILISIDTLRADHIHGYGYGPETTPSLDKLMEQGTTFTNAVSVSPWTLPSHISLFTSQYPHTHGVTDNGLALAEGVPTLTELIAREGYRTLGFGTCSYLLPQYGFIKAFDAYVCADVTAPIACGQSLRWLSGVKEEPFFLFLHFYDVHSSYEPMPKYLSKFETSYEGEIDGTEHFLFKVRDGTLKLSDADLRHVIALYDAEINQLDNVLGTFFETLEKRGLMSDTVIVVTSDHGEEFLDHGGILHGGTLYDEAMRIPLIVVGPGIPAGKRVDKQVQLIDIMPTLLEIADADFPSGMEGRSLLPLIRHEEVEWAELAFMEADNKNEKHDIKRAARNGRYKLYYDRYTGAEEFYDLAADPREKYNVLKTHSREASELRMQLKSWMTGKRGKPVPFELTEKEKEKLRALGYLN